VFNLGPQARVVFAAAWIAGQAALVLTGSRREDHILSFRMFPEASTLEIHLSRVTVEGVVPVPRSGEWTATGSGGDVHHFSWHDRVRDSVLSTLDTRIFASYGVDVQLARLQRALDDVEAHLDGDHETVRLRADVTVSKNGHEPVAVTVLGKPRWGG
jgi:hypothetical protein